ncbi:MAG: OadG family protein [Desulfamplus sp.]|nr:OadG family protein [Desulfamplus sp.]
MIIQHKATKSIASRRWLICLSLIVSTFVFLLLQPELPAAYASSKDAKKSSAAVSGQELEKPKPVFTKIDETISAKLIPRAKSTSVIIDFNVSKGGKLIDVKGMDFEKAARPEVDIKNYKSSLFIVEIGDVLPVGSDATLSISSDFFSSGTEYRVFNEKLPQPWFNSECHNVASKGRVRELIISIKDGGPFDSDGEANGSITFVGGPRDSFWGYALGTLFIRFFGIFLVLSVLMAGMMLSGVIFSRIEAKKSQKESDDTSNLSGSDVIEPASAELEEPQEEAVAGAESSQEEEPQPFESQVDDYEIAAAIATALHLHFQRRSPSVAAESQDFPTTASRIICPVQTNTWSNDGRTQMMRDRQMSFNRTNR